MEETRHSGAKLLLVISLLGVIALILLIAFALKTNETLPENVVLLNKLQREKTIACYRSKNKERCEQVKKELEEVLKQLGGK